MPLEPILFTLVLMILKLFFMFPHFCLLIQTIRNNYKESVTLGMMLLLSFSKIQILINSLLTASLLISITCLLSFKNVTKRRPLIQILLTTSSSFILYFPPFLFIDQQIISIYYSLENRLSVTFKDTITERSRPFLQKPCIYKAYYELREFLITKCKDPLLYFF